MGNLSVKTFTANGTFTPPAGVTKVTVVAQSLQQSMLGYGPNNMFLDAYGNLFGMGQNSGGPLGTGDASQHSNPTIAVGAQGFTQFAFGGANNGTTGGQPYVLALNKQGLCYAWGNNTNGNLGNSTTTSRSSPVPIVGSFAFSQVAASDFGASFGLTPAGSLYSWGSNINGALGQNLNPGTTAATSSPAAVVGGLTFSWVKCIGNTIFALTTGNVLYAWGNNTGGCIGDGTIVPKSSPVAVAGGLSIASLGSNYAPNGTFNTHTTGNTIFAITTSGSAFAWGSNQNGALGANLIPTTNVARSSPVAVVGGLTFSQIASVNTGNGYSAIGLTTDGTVFGWGANEAGQVGNNTSQNAFSSPVAVVGGLTFSSIYMMENAQAHPTSFGLTSAGLLYSWGSNFQGGLGANLDPGVTTGTSSPVAVVGGLTIMQVANIHYDEDGSSGTTMMALDSTGNVYSWGSNGNGQQGSGNTTGSSSPAVVVGYSTGQLQQPITTTPNITVVPNTSYSIYINQQTSTFGNFAVGYGPMISISVYFEE